MSDNRVQVLVCSCDKYRDVWPAFFQLFFKYWRDCPYGVNLIANDESYCDERVTTLHIDRRLDWSSAFLESLSLLTAPYVLVLMEDYLLERAVDSQGLSRLAEYMDERRVECIHVYPENKSEGDPISVQKYTLKEVPEGFPYRVNLQAALWRRDYLISLVRAGESAWDFEVAGTGRSETTQATFLTVTCSPEAAPFSYYCTGVVRGKWMPGAVALCRKEGIALDLTKRKVGYVRGLFRDVAVLQPFRRAFVCCKRSMGLN